MKYLLVIAATVCGSALFGGDEGFSVDIARSVILAHSGQDKAAAELKTHLEAISGSSVPIVSDEGCVKENTFVWQIGLSDSATDAHGLSPEECRWSISRERASFYGEGRRGALFAVYSFLEDALGVRWPSGTNICYRPRKTLTIRKNTVKWKWKPELKNREIRSSTKEGAVWSSRMRMGRHDYPRYGHAFPLYWQKFSKTRPEFFAMRKDGKRLPVGVEAAGENAQVYTGRADRKIAMCVTSTGLVEQIIADWRNAGAGPYVNVCENDANGKDVCHCPDCLALDEPPQPGMLPTWVTCYADRYVYFTRRVLDRAREFRSDVRACLYAYNYSEQPPRRERLDSDMLVGLVPVEFAWDVLVGYVEGWKKAGMQEFFHRPNRHWHFRMRNLPMGSEEYFFRVFRYLVKEGATGFDYDSPGAFGESEWFRDYILAKAMQDPARDFAFWENHYCQAYGAAADDVKAYYRYWRENVWPKIERDMESLTRKGGFNVARAVLRTVDTYYRESDFFIAASSLQKALERPGLSGPSRSGIERLVVANEHARLLFRAASSRSRADIEALGEFRKAKGFELRPPEEGGIVEIPPEVGK